MASEKEILTRAKEVFDIEIAGLEAVRDSLNSSFAELTRRCMETIANGGKLIWTGIGKSGHVGKKIAATLASVGSPSIFIHPVEARHGDLGMIQKNDLMIALSYSGETEELLCVLTPAKRLGVGLIAITGNESSTLAKICDVTVGMTIPQEACPFNLAPTTSTTALLALGDALAMVLLDCLGFTKSDYGMRHPGGAIGRMVTMTAADIMRDVEHSALVQQDTPVREALLQMTHARCGSAIVIDGERKLLGIFTDGDFRRCAEKDMSVLERLMKDVMIPSPVSVQKDALAVEVLKILEKRSIDDIVVVDSDNVVQGFIDVQDLPGLKLM